MTSRESMLGNALPSFYLQMNRVGLLKRLNVAWHYQFSLKNEFQNPADGPDPYSVVQIKAS